METINKIKLFISCPGDITNEIDSIKMIVKNINKTSGQQNHFLIETVHWDEDTYTEIGNDGQEIINRQIDYDILVGLMWLRIGTPTKRDKSGTIEEINRALADNSKEQLIYFKTGTPPNLKEINPEELQKVNQFKQKLISQGVLFKEFDSIAKFDSLFQINLSNLIADKFLQNKNRDNSNEIEKSSKPQKEKIDNYKEVRDLIAEVEKSSKNEFDFDLFAISEETTSHLSSVTFSMRSMTEATNILGKNLKQRTIELNQTKAIKDTRLKLKKNTTTVNLLSNELQEFNDRINRELPVFSESLSLVSNSYSKIILAAKTLDRTDESGLKNGMYKFRDSLKFTMESSAKILTEIRKWPPINPNFNKSKRDTELTLTNLTKEILDALTLMDAAL